MRRSNKSNKVPNVKLRPAPVTHPGRDHDQDASYDHSSDSEMPPDASMVDRCPRPFRSFYLCATGTMDKPALFKMAFELGAESTNDFTDKVTHLIADSYGGAKYLCAVERKIPIMTPDWIAESHSVWLRGDDVDVEQSIAKFRFPIFSGVVLSLSGIEDVQRRTEINRLVTVHQGTYVKNIERPVWVTHLLCSGDIETDKMKYAEKFNKRREAHIHLVWEEWFWDSLEFGGRFDERKYQVSRPRPEKRKSLQTNFTPPLPVRDTALDSHSNAAIAVEKNDRPRRLKPAVPTGSFTVLTNLAIDGEEEEMAVVNKPVPAVTLQLWQSLLRPRGFELDSGKLVRSPSKSQALQSPASPSIPPRTRPGTVSRNASGVQHEKEKESVISSFRRAKSFAPVPVNEPAVRQPFRRNTTCPSICPGEAEASGVNDPVSQQESVMKTLFSGYTFRLLGEARCPNVRLAIENGGGVVTENDAEEPSFTIVRLISGSKLYLDELDDYARTKYRTECWLEHSVFHERICESDENVTFTPLRITTLVPDAEKINLSLSGLDQSQLCWIRRLVRAVGVTLESTFSRRTTHLICPCGNGAKFEKALEWRIPVVSLAWLEDIAKTGTIPLLDGYLVGGSCGGGSVNGEDGFGRAQLLDPIPEVKRDKGKGKEKDTDCQMMDITNDMPTSKHPMFVKNTTLLPDIDPRNLESEARHLRGKLSQTRSPARNGLFGKSRFLTHDSDLPEGAEAHGHHDHNVASSPPDPPPQSSSPATAEIELLIPEPAPLGPVLPAPLDSRLTHDADGVANAQTRISTQTRTQTPIRTQTQIPSSISPSPMKLPPSSLNPDPFAPSSSSPGPPDTNAIAKALHESLTSLLGKRPIAEADEVVREEAGVKKGKRVRPGGPSNMTSRNASYETLDSPTRSVVRPLVPLPLPPPGLDINTSLLDGLGMGGGPPTEKGLRVRYEDPGQAEQKRRLLRMLGGVDSDEAEMVGVESEIRGSRAAGGDKGAGAGASRTRRTRRAKVSC